jgi:hypothetical protein
MTPRIPSQFPLEIYVRRSLTRIAAALVLTASMSAYGTIMHGTSQDIGLQSSPSSAKLTKALAKADYGSTEMECRVSPRQWKNS